MLKLPFMVKIKEVESLWSYSQKYVTLQCISSMQYLLFVIKQNRNCCDKLKLLYFGYFGIFCM